MLLYSSMIDSATLVTVSDLRYGWVMSIEYRSRDMWKVAQPWRNIRKQLEVPVCPGSRMQETLNNFVFTQVDERFFPSICVFMKKCWCGWRTPGLPFVFKRGPRHLFSQFPPFGGLWRHLWPIWAILAQTDYPNYIFKTCLRRPVPAGAPFWAILTKNSNNFEKKLHIVLDVYGGFVTVEHHMLRDLGSNK